MPGSCHLVWVAKFLLFSSLLFPFVLPAHFPSVPWIRFAGMARPALPSGHFRPVSESFICPRVLIFLQALYNPGLAHYSRHNVGIFATVGAFNLLVQNYRAAVTERKSPRLASSSSSSLPSPTAPSCHGPDTGPVTWPFGSGWIALDPSARSRPSFRRPLGRANPRYYLLPTQYFRQYIPFDRRRELDRALPAGVHSSAFDPAQVVLLAQNQPINLAGNTTLSLLRAPHFLDGPSPSIIPLQPSSFRRHRRTGIPRAHFSVHPHVGALLCAPSSHGSPPFLHKLGYERRLPSTAAPLIVIHDDLDRTFGSVSVGFGRSSRYGLLFPSRGPRSLSLFGLSPPIS